MAGDGLLDTNIIILRRSIAPEALPDRMAISSITLAELSAGVHHVSGDDPTARDERARRIDVLQRTETEFDAIPFDSAAARLYGRISAAVLDAGRMPRRRIADLMIAAVAGVNELPLYTTNPDDFSGVERIVRVIAIPHPGHS